MKKSILSFLVSFFLFSSYAWAAFEGNYSYDYTPLSGLGVNYQLHFYPDGNGKYWVNDSAHPFLWRQQDDKTLMLIMEDRSIEMPNILTIVSDNEIQVGDDVYTKIEYEDHEDFDDEPEDYPDVPDSSSASKAAPAPKKDLRKPPAPGSEQEKAYKIYANSNPNNDPFLFYGEHKRGGWQFVILVIEDNLEIEKFTISSNGHTCSYTLVYDENTHSFPAKLKMHAQAILLTNCSFRKGDIMRVDAITNVGEFSNNYPLL